MSAKEAQTQSCPKLIWGAEAIGEVIGRNTKQVHYPKSGTWRVALGGRMAD